VGYSPHRRVTYGSLEKRVRRAWERAVVVLYRAASAVLVLVPLGISTPVAEVLFQLGYLAWPAKRRIVLDNAAHVLGRPLDDPEVARLARRIHASYARFALELMRLPSLPPDEPARLLVPDEAAHERFMGLWRRCQDGGHGLIAVSGHIGSIEVFAGAYARRGIPTYGLADDTAFPELFELLTRSRARWGVTIIPWRDLRQIYRIMRSPAALGMVVDWGYRPDDVPVRLFGAWTTLPAGPATLAARTGAVILPVVARRRPDGRYLATAGDAIEVPDASPRELRRATQAIADALESMVREAPDQWYTFKPIWPASDDEGELLRRRAAAMDADDVDPRTRSRGTAEAGGRYPRAPRPGPGSAAEAGGPRAPAPSGGPT
jgi:KDO2-lipid IV(A) lauroyltransferase